MGTFVNDLSFLWNPEELEEDEYNIQLTMLIDKNTYDEKNNYVLNI